VCVCVCVCVCVYAVDFHVLVLTSGSWPWQAQLNFQLPPEVIHSCTRVDIGRPTLYLSNLYLGYASVQCTHSTLSSVQPFSMSSV
jgi:hypothetical protein